MRFSALQILLVCLVFPGLGSANEGVWRKPGFWNVSLWDETRSVMRAVSVRQCTDVRTEPEVLLSILPAQENCTALDVFSDGGKLIIRTRCKTHDTDVNGEMILTGDLQSAYHGEAMVSFKRGFASSVPGRKQFFKAQWLGACPVGMIPGEMLLSNGIKVNVLKMPPAPRP
ncbi:MAG: DUF3617 domain-containing protein [Pseudomonadota bacterium]